MPSWRSWHHVLNKGKNNIVKCEVTDKDTEKLRKVREELAKQKADYITETSDNDGVAKAIYKFVLENAG